LAQAGRVRDQDPGQLVVVTLKSLQGTSIEDYGYQLGRHWQIGHKEKKIFEAPRCFTRIASSGVLVAGFEIGLAVDYLQALWPP